MADSPNIRIKLPSQTLWVYLLLGVLGCLSVSIMHIINIHPDYFSSVGTVLDFITGVMFLIFAMICGVRATRRLDVYNDRIIRKSILGHKTTYFKDINGHHVDDSSNNSLGFAKGYFRGIIVKLKNGRHFSLNKAEMDQFEAVKKHFRPRCRYFNSSSIKRQIRKEDRKLYLFLISVLVILIASLLH